MSSNLRVNNIFPSVGTNVAIGTAGGSITLTGTVSGSSNINVGTGASISSPATNVLTLGTNNVEVARFDSNGRLGIGTDIPSSYDQGARTLVLSESLYSGITLRTNNQSTGQNAIYFSDGLTGNEAFRGRIEYYHSSDSLTFGTAGTGSRVVIDSSGRFGLGTGTVDQLLHVLKHQNGETGIIVENQWGTSGANSSLTLKTADVAGSSTSTFTINKYKNGTVNIANNETNSAANITFIVGSSERGRFNSTGAFVLAGGSTSANGIGIAFPATQSASTDANTLDDYEEGTWTPALTFGGGSTGITYTARAGAYTKIGNIVTVGCYIELSNKGSSTGNANIVTLPFAAYVPSYPISPGILILENGGSSWPATGTYGLAWSDSNVYLRYNGTTSFTQITNTSFTNTTAIYWSSTYRVS